MKDNMQKSRILTNFNVYADKMIEKGYTAIKKWKTCEMHQYEL